MPIHKNSATDGVVSRWFDWEILTRIAAPLFVGLAVLAMISRSSPVLAVVVFVAAFVVLDISALTAGHDSRDGLDWKRCDVDRLAAPAVVTAAGGSSPVVGR